LNVDSDGQMGVTGWGGHEMVVKPTSKKICRFGRAGLADECGTRCRKELGATGYGARR